MSPDGFELVRYVGEFYLYLSDRNLREAFSQFSMIWRFSRKTHRWLRSVFIFLLLTDRSFERSRYTLFFKWLLANFTVLFCSSAEFRTFLLKNSVFLAAAYLQKCFLADFAGFFHLLLLRCCRWEERFPHFSLGCPQNSRVFFSSTPTPFVLLLGLKVYEVRNVFTPNPSWYDQYQWRGGRTVWRRSLRGGVGLKSFP